MLTTVKQILKGIIPKDTEPQFSEMEQVVLERWARHTAKAAEMVDKAHFVELATELSAFEMDLFRQLAQEGERIDNNQEFSVKAMNLLLANMCAFDHIQDVLMRRIGSPITVMFSSQVLNFYKWSSKCRK